MSKITFDEQKHLYTVDGIEAISVTTLLKAVGLGKDYSNQSDFVKELVRKASQRGNYYDQLAAEAIENPFELNEWQERFLEVLAENKIEAHFAQVRFGTTEPFAIAGTADFKGRNVESGKKAIIDLKATAEIYVNDVTWQTNLYSWLDDKEYFEHYDKFVVHYNEKDDRFTVLKLDNIELKNIEKVLNCYQLGDLYTEENPLSKIVDMQVFSNTFSKVKEYEALLKEEEGKLKKFYESIMEHMRSNNIKTFDLNKFKITYTPEGTRRNVDYAKAAEDKNEKILKEANGLLTVLGYPEVHIYTTSEVKELLTPEELKEYTSISTVKHRLTVTEK